MAKGTLDSFKSTKKAGSSSLKGKAAIAGAPPAASAKSASTGTKKASPKKKAKKGVDEDEDGGDVVLIDSKGKERRKLKVNDPRYHAHYTQALQEGLQGMELLHADGQSKAETILKLFDLNAEYGPALGMTRLERWQRAADWGLEPPEEVYDILTTVEGDSDAKYRESLFDGCI